MLALPPRRNRALRGLSRADDRPHSPGATAVPALLPAAGRDVRPLRAGPHDRSARCRRRPGPVRTLLARADGRLRELRERAAVPWRAARTDAVRLVRTGHAAGMRTLRSRATPGGALAGGPGVRQLLPALARGQGHLPAVRADPARMRYPSCERPVCRECAGAPAHNLCGRCDAEDAPYARGLCARCVLHDRLTELLGDQPKRVQLGLDGLFDELAAARSAKDVLKWLGRSSAVRLLGRIARGELPFTHETLDRHASDPAVRRLEHLLVATGALPTRDPALARLERWTEDLLAEHEAQPALRRFAHWVVLRRYRRKSQRAPLNDGVLSRAKVEMRSAAAFLHSLTERDRTLETCGQADVDAWLAGDRADRYIARSFARFAMAQKLMPKVDFPASHRDGPTQPVSDSDRFQLAKRLLADQRISPRDRLAAILIAVFAQPVSRVARLTIDDVALDDQRVAIRFGETAVTLPQQIAEDARRLIAERGGALPATVRQSPWLFPGNPPSRPIGELALSRRMKRIGIQCKDERRAALLHLAGRLPAAILADLLGVHVSTATKWAEIAGRPWGDYPALRAQDSSTRRRRPE